MHVHPLAMSDWMWVCVLIDLFRDVLTSILW